MRFIHVQENVPGMLRRLNDVFAQRGVNIAAQFYQTDGELGYVVLDADETGEDGAAILADLGALEGTIRARLLYERH
jgi:D-3-phosphoglycerate dehydrogenase